MWILIVVSTVFGSSLYATQGISSIAIQSFYAKETCEDAARNIYEKVKKLGYRDPQKYVQASCIPAK